MFEPEAAIFERIGTSKMLRKQRNKSIFSETSLRRLGYCLLGLILAIITIFASSITVRAAPPSTLVQQGKIAYDRGDFPTALNSWERAEAIYRQERDLVGMTGSRVNQAQALTAMGLYRRACKTLTTTVRVGGENVCEAGIPVQFGIRQTNLPPSLQALALNTFGDVLRLVGNFDAAQVTLAAAGKVAQPLRAEDRSPIFLNIAHTLRDLGHRDLQLTHLLQPPTNLSIACQTQPVRSLKAAEYYQRAIACYRQADRLAARLNQLSLQLEIDRWLEERAKQPLAKLWQQQFTLNQPISIERIKVQLAAEPFTYEGLDRRVNFARSLVLSKPPQLTVAREQLELVITQGQLLGQKLAVADATGTLGWLYERDRQWAKAVKFTQQALALTTNPGNDTTYQWEWQMGRILQHQDRPDLVRSQAAYDRAVVALERNRRDIRVINRDAQFSLRDRIEPLYREAIDLSLRAAHPDLERVIDRVDALKLAELENFLQCQLGEYRFVGEFAQDSGAAVFYPVILDDRLEVILRLAGHKFQRFVVPVSRDRLETTVASFRQSLSQPQYGWNSEAASQLYDWLIRPAQTYLNPQTKNLVFVMDGALQNIPVAALYDRVRQEYLIDRYPVAVTPGLKILGAKNAVEDRSRILIGGLTGGSSIVQNGQRGGTYEPLTYAATEIQAIKSLFPRSTELSGKDFTQAKIQRALAGESYSIVHLATHGQFSSDPRQTFIVSDGGKTIDLSNLRSILQQGRSQSIDTIVLSACETATGDRQAALGLAGMAIRSGAGSTLASMWSVDDRATAKLMQKFYTTLTQRERTSKAEALRMAQRKIRAEYEHPYYWASFVLVGNWL
jgi:CHAT domain-containing protein